MPKGDIGDGATAAEDTNPSLSAPGEDGDAVHDVAAIGDLHDVGPERIGAVPGDDDGRLGLVLGPGGSSAGSPADLCLSGAEFFAFNVVCRGG